MRNIHKPGNDSYTFLFGLTLIFFNDNLNAPKQSKLYLVGADSVLTLDVEWDALQCGWC